MILIGFLVIVLCFLASQSEMRRALYWWQQRRSSQLQQKAEEMREGLLQELFSCRRSLELQLAHPETSIQTLQWCLNKVNELYHYIEQLSYDLSPPYVDESLPLALQHLLEQWRIRNSTLSFEIDLPSLWRDNPHRNQIVLETLDELLKLTLMEIQLESPVYVGLQNDRNRGKLTVQITYSDSAALMASSRAKHLQYLMHSFQLLASGQCRSRKQGLTMTWYFRWRLPSRTT